MAFILAISCEKRHLLLVDIVLVGVMACEVYCNDVTILAMLISNVMYVVYCVFVG